MLGAVLTANQKTYMYSTVPLQHGQFSKKKSQKTPHSSPVRAGYGVSFVDPGSDYILDQSLKLSMKYLTLLDQIITAFDCIWKLLLLHSYFTKDLCYY